MHYSQAVLIWTLLTFNFQKSALIYFFEFVGGGVLWLEGNPRCTHLSPIPPYPMNGQPDNL